MKGRWFSFSSDFSGCPDTYPRKMTSSCKRSYSCSKLKNRCNSSFKQVLPSNCEKSIKPKSDLNKRVNQLCLKSCRTRCPGKSILWYIILHHDYFIFLLFSYSKFSILAHFIIAVNGRWGLWSPYSSCTKTCGIGSKKRTRECTNPPPLAGGENCVGETEQIIQCNTNSCSGKCAVELW